MDEPVKQVFYALQYNVITYSPQGQPVQVCFHGPKVMGFSSAEMAAKAISKLEDGDVNCNKTHVYDIVPVLVSEDFGEGSEVVFTMDDDDQFEEEDEVVPASN